MKPPLLAGLLAAFSVVPASAADAPSPEGSAWICRLSPERNRLPHYHCSNSEASGPVWEIPAYAMPEPDRPEWVQLLLQSAMCRVRSDCSVLLVR